MDIQAEVKETAADIEAQLDNSFEQTKEQFETIADSAQDNLAQGKVAVQDTLSTSKQGAQNAMKAAKSQISDSIEGAKNAPQETLKGVTRQMAEAKQSFVSPESLKRRLDWGEPALTIIDVRHREVFQREHIQGAVSVPEADLITQVSKIVEPTRDIFIYGATETQMSQSAMSLIDAGFGKVAALEGGLEGWKKIDGPTEGIAA